MIEYENLYQLNEPFIRDYQRKFDEVLRSGWFILGSQVHDFENQFAQYCGSKFCIGVGNGLDALTLALRSFCFRPGSEVVVPSNTYVATILSIINCGLRPILVEPAHKPIPPAGRRGGAEGGGSGKSRVGDG